MKAYAIGVFVGLLHSTTALAQVVPDDPRIHFTFEDTLGIGQVIEDSSGSFLHGWSGTDPVLRSFVGLQGDAMQFDGRTSRVDLPADAIKAVANLTEGSIFVRFVYNERIFNRQTIDPIVYVGIGDTGDVDSMVIIEIGHNSPTDRMLYFTWVIDGVVTLCFDTNFNLESGQVYSFLGVVGPAGNTGYLNGEELVGRDYNFGDADMQIFFADLPRASLDLFSLGFGKAVDGLTPNLVHHFGMIDDFAVFNRVLTPAEAIAITTLP